jgi:hypothetical protein
MQKIYVLYNWVSYEGNSAPLGVFSTLEKAEAYKKKFEERECHKSSSHGYDIDELELDFEDPASLPVVC